MCVQEIEIEREKVCVYLRASNYFIICCTITADNEQAMNSQRVRYKRELNSMMCDVSDSV